MKIDKPLLQRVRILNICIILLLAVSFLGNFAKGFSAGWQVAQYEEKAKVSTSFHVINLEPSKPSIGTPIKNGTTVKGGISISQAMITLINPPHSSTITLLRGLYTLLTLAIFIALIILIWKTTNSIGSGDMVSNKNIKRIRTIGILLIGKDLTAIIYQYFESQYLNKMAIVEGYKVTVEILSTSLVIGLIMLVFAEILTVANRLREEQELTI